MMHCELQIDESQIPRKSLRQPFVRIGKMAADIPFQRAIRYADLLFQ